MRKVIGLSMLLGLIAAGCGPTETVIQPGEKPPVVEPEPEPEPFPQPEPNPIPNPGNQDEFAATVVPVFEVVCARCHTPQSGLPFDFMTDEGAARGAALASIKRGSMPIGAANIKNFAPNKARVIEILSD